MPAQAEELPEYGRSMVYGAAILVVLVPSDERSG